MYVEVDGTPLASLERERHTGSAEAFYFDASAYGVNGLNSADHVPLRLNTKRASVMPMAIAVAWHADRALLPPDDTYDAFVYVEAKVATAAADDFAEGVVRILKKNMPEETTVALVFPADGFDLGGGRPGRLYVGLATHQTTGGSFHASAHLYPTVERENVDFSDRYVAVTRCLRAGTPSPLFAPSLFSAFLVLSPTHPPTLISSRTPGTFRSGTRAWSASLAP